MSSQDDSRPDLDFGPTLRGFAANQRLFDRYVLREILGRGGMGVVWRAHDEQLECEVALKFLPEMVAFDEQAIADLKRETRKTRELRHHHIVQVYDFVTDKRSACISMECVDGPTLSAIKARKESGCMEVDEITEWVKQLCEALSYAHERAKIVHRDLKPANLMINGRSELKVTDFGIARSVSDSVTMLTMTRGTSGTLVYMSPQQLDGERTSRLDDIYSLGATLYELLTSKPPFHSGDVSYQIKHLTPVSMQQRRIDLELVGSPIPRQWEDTVAACLAKDPSQRPQSTGEIAARCGLTAPWHQTPNINGARKKAAPVALGEEATRAAVQHRKWILATVFLVLILIGSLFAWLKFKREEKRLLARPNTEAKVQATQPQEQQQKTAEGAKKQENSLKAFAEVTKEHPYENSLGMKFVPVPETRVLFSVWDTRVKDYKLFAEATKHDWSEAGFTQTDEHPAVNVSWDDATAFCKWLTEKERKTGSITANQRYRLPTDLEWSAAVGLRSESESTPEERDSKVKGVYPWGTKWPPPNGAGNYDPSVKVDYYKQTSPVETFGANQYGLYDMGGNVWQWCEDWWNAEKKYHVMRGASWYSGNPDLLLSSYRGVKPEFRRDAYGFRCVLETQSPR